MTPHFLGISSQGHSVYCTNPMYLGQYTGTYCGEELINKSNFSSTFKLTRQCNLCGVVKTRSSKEQEYQKDIITEKIEKTAKTKWQYNIKKDKAIYTWWVWKRTFDNIITTKHKLLLKDKNLKSVLLTTAICPQINKPTILVCPLEENHLCRYYLIEIAWSYFTMAVGPCEIPRNSPASPRKTKSMPTLFLRVTLYLK